MFQRMTRNTLGSPSIERRCLCSYSSLAAHLVTTMIHAQRSFDPRMTCGYLEDLSNENNDDENNDETAEKDHEDVRWSEGKIFVR